MICGWTGDRLVIYVDSSALLKLVVDEPESAALEAWLSYRARVPVVSSELAKVEVLRACRRVNAEALPQARALLAGLDLVRLSTDVIDSAAEVGDAALRTLDAIHLASALSIREHLSAFVAYDQRLLDAASVAGFEPARPT
jgi:predicted nucleic acid-binding protein